MEYLLWAWFRFNGRMGRADYWINAYGWCVVTAIPVVEPVEGVANSGSRTSEAILNGEFVGVPGK